MTITLGVTSHPWWMKKFIVPSSPPRSCFDLPCFQGCSKWVQELFGFQPIGNAVNKVYISFSLLPCSQSVGYWGIVGKCKNFVFSADVTLKTPVATLCATRNMPHKQHRYCKSLGLKNKCCNAGVKCNMPHNQHRIAKLLALKISVATLGVKCNMPHNKHRIAKLLALKISVATLGVKRNTPHNQHRYCKILDHKNSNANNNNNNSIIIIKKSNEQEQNNQSNPPSSVKVTSQPDGCFVSDSLIHGLPLSPPKLIILQCIDNLTLTQFETSLKPI